MVAVFINRENYQVPEPGILADILPLLHIGEPDGIAIAVNEHVIPRTEWGQFILQARDQVFVIRATQGG